MLADYFTKALQGKQFAQLRDVIMGKISVQQLFDMNTALKERVGKRLSAVDAFIYVDIITNPGFTCLSGLGRLALHTYIYSPYVFQIRL